MSALHAVVGSARSASFIAHALMSVTAGTPASASAPALALALQSVIQFRGVWPYLVLALRRNHHMDRTRIARTLSRMWSESPDAWDVDSVRGLARVAHACFHFSLATRALQTLRKLGASTPPDLVLEAHCRAGCGELRQALALCASVLAHSPQHKVATEMHRHWTQREQAWRGPWHVPVEGLDGLRMEPLHMEHALPLAWQYRDPAIAAKTLLPALPGPGAAPAWIENRLADPHIVAYAVLHREHGFVGSVELTVSGTEAFLCIWMGTDWQGQGLGRRTIALACEHAFRCGIDVMLTAAYDNNAASLGALRGRGFFDVPIRAEAPDHDRTFLCLPARPLEPDDIVRRLIGFAVRAETGLVFAIPPFPFPRAGGEPATEPAPDKEDR